jgi:periplasmic divalent cation tolerance protein
MLIVVTTCPDIAEAKSLAKKIVDARLGACVQILPQMTSVYYWENEVREDPEHLLMIKTLSAKWDELKDLIKKEHSYSVPEIVGIEPTQVSGAYARWMKSYLKEG